MTLAKEISKLIQDKQISDAKWIGNSLVFELKNKISSEQLARIKSKGRLLTESDHHSIVISTSNFIKLSKITKEIADECKTWYKK